MECKKTIFCREKASEHGEQYGLREGNRVEEVLHNKIFRFGVSAFTPRVWSIA